MSKTGFPPAVIAIIKARAGIQGDFVRCEKCRYWCQNGCAHHRRPRGHGGSKAEDTNVASNGVWLCASCHSWAELRRTDALEKGWLVPQGQSPAEWPILRDGERYLLNDSGDFVPMAVGAEKTGVQQ